jgi:demethylmenaquinone methyltransferase/2-methoxy-6-polyprenyl-1,4-benzoquinol methylase
MESRFRYRFFGPQQILAGAGILPGQRILEIGCGTGFFTIPAARIIGENGSLVSLDIVPEAVRMVSRKVQEAGLTQVTVIEGNAMATNLAASSFDAVLLFGVIPAPMLPVERLLPEMSRLLKPGGTLAVWPPVPGWLPQAILRTGLFSFAGKRNGVSIFQPG